MSVSNRSKSIHDAYIESSHALHGKKTQDVKKNLDEATTTATNTTATGGTNVTSGSTSELSFGEVFKNLKSLPFFKLFEDVCVKINPECSASN